MKLLTYLGTDGPAGQPRCGALLDDGSTVVDLGAAARLAGDARPDDFTALLTLLEAGDAGRGRVENLLEFAGREKPPEVFTDLAGVQLLAPIPRPASLRDCMAFEQHLVQAMRTVARWRAPWVSRLDRLLARSFGRPLLRVPQVWYERPIYYKGNPRSVVGHEAAVRWPSYAVKLDYELEFGIFIGRPGRDIPPAEAHRHIAGYSIFNDFSARDVQLREMQGRLGPAKGKDFDTGNVIGPYLVTPDEVPDAGNLAMTARVNGDLWSQTSSRDMHFSFAEIIAYISRDETLYPGDFIAAGTAPGGCGLELDRFLQPGDVVELEVEHLGVLRNRVVRE